MSRSITFLCALLITINAHAGPKKCKCDEDAIANRETKNENWNRNIHEACASILNKDFAAAYTSLEEALKLGEDAYIQGMFNCLKEMKNSGAFSAQPVSTTQPVQEVKQESPTPATESPAVSPAATGAAVTGATVMSDKPEEIKPVPAHVEEEKKEEVRKFTTEELTSFQAKGMQKVKTFQNYLNKIGNKSTSINDGMEAITNALKLFYGTTYVQVSSTSKDAKPKFPTKTYLERVRALNYDKVSIEWAECQYASNLKKAPDGNYYGYIKFRQRFKGIKDDKVVYEDITDKTIAVVLRAYDKAIEGEKVENFDIFLGDIDVVMTSKN